MIRTQQELEIALSETMQWCFPKIDTENPRGCFRSSELQPYIEKYDKDVEAFWPLKAQIEELCEARTKLLASKVPVQKAQTPAGRLLISFPDWNNHNYLAQGESSYYLDGFDNPPWDTWLGWVPCADESELLLLSWIPPEFIELVQNGIDVEACGMIFWPNSELLESASYPDQQLVRKVPKWLWAACESAI